MQISQRIRKRRREIVGSWGRRIRALAANRASNSPTVGNYLLNWLLRATRARRRDAIAAFRSSAFTFETSTKLLQAAAETAATGLGAELALVRKLAPNGETTIEAAYGWTLPHSDKETGSCLSVPIRMPGRQESVFGLLDVRSTRPRSFTQTDQQFLEETAAIVALALALQEASEATHQLSIEAERAVAMMDALEGSPLVGVGILDTDLKYVHVNAALARINGASPEAHIGKSVRDVVGHHADTIEPALRKLLANGRQLAQMDLVAAPPSTPDQMRSFLGNYFAMRSRKGEPLGIGIIVVEITDRARAEEALRKSEERIKRALSIQTVGVLFFTLDGRILDVNPALERLSGYSRDELRNMHWKTLTPPEFEETTAHTAHSLATTGKAEPYEKQWIRPDGSRWWGLFAPAVLSREGSVVECAEFIIDITNRKQADEALQQAIRAREEILGVVSHDLKNPLGAIHLAASMLARKQASDPRIAKSTETILRSASRMDHLIGDLLDMASIQAGRLAVVREPVDPDALVNEAIETHEPHAKNKGVRIVRDCALANGLGRKRLSCDKERILQVFGNLIGNAIKFCQTGDTVTLRGRIEDNAIHFAVADTGPGISDKDLPHIFEPYWSATRHVKKGTGLGLYICKGIVEAHGGTVRVESKAGFGATFMFSLPLDLGSKQ